MAVLKPRAAVKVSIGELKLVCTVSYHTFFTVIWPLCCDAISKLGLVVPVMVSAAGLTCKDISLC